MLYNLSNKVFNLVENSEGIEGYKFNKNTVDADSSKESILESARADERVSSAVDGKTIVKEIYVPGKLVNIVVK